MHEGPPKHESAPKGAGIDAYEALLEQGRWDSEAKRELEALCKRFPDELHLLHLIYEESGFVPEGEYEQQMCALLKEHFGEDSNEEPKE